MKKNILISGLVFFSVFCNGQEKCNLRFSKKEKIYSVNTEDIKCLSLNSSKKNTLFYTFGVWCKACRFNLPYAIELSKEKDLDFFVLLVEAEEDEKAKEAIEYLNSLKKDIKIVILKDDFYGFKRSKKNKKFVEEITPKRFVIEDDYSKYILLNNKGEVLMVTNWRDNEGYNWKDDSEMIKKKIIPLL